MTSFSASSSGTHMNKPNATFVALILLTASIAGCLGESKEEADEVPIGTWIDNEGNLFTFFANGSGEITHLRDSFWEYPDDLYREKEGIDSFVYETEEFEWEKSSNSLSIRMYEYNETIGIYQNFTTQEQIIFLENEEYFKLGGSCKKFVYFSANIRTKEDLSAAWSSFNVIESAYYNENSVNAECYDSWFREQAWKNAGRIQILNVFIGDNQDLNLIFRTSLGGEWILDEMIHWTIHCERENTTYVEDGNLSGLVYSMVEFYAEENQTNTQIVDQDTQYVGHIIPTDCAPTLGKDAIYLSVSPYGSHDSGVLKYNSIEPGYQVI